MIIKSRDVFFEDVFLYKREENKTSEKRTHEKRSWKKDPVNQQLMRKLNQEEVRDRESLNLLVQIT